MDTPEVPATSAPTPTERLREGATGTKIRTKAGLELVIMPARVTAADLLDKGGEQRLRYAELAQRTRDQWVAQKQGKTGSINEDDWGDLAIMAIMTSYEVSEEELPDLKWFNSTDDVLTIVGAVWGFGSVDKIRKRALALAVAGLGDLSLSASESAFLADWAWNEEKAPKMRES
jgi:hypothetical protein